MIASDHRRPRQTFGTSAGRNKDNQRPEIKANSALFLVVDRQLHTATLSALFSRVFDRIRVKFSKYHI